MIPTNARGHGPGAVRSHLQKTLSGLKLWTSPSASKRPTLNFGTFLKCEVLGLFQGGGETKVRLYPSARSSERRLGRVQQIAIRAGRRGSRPVVRRQGPGVATTRGRAVQRLEHVRTSGGLMYSRVGAMTEAAAMFARTDAGDAQKCPPHRLHAAESAAVGDDGQLQSRRLQEVASSFDPHALDEPSRRDADLGGEDSCEVSFGDRRALGEIGERVRRAGFGDDRVDQWAKCRTTRQLQREALGEL